MHHHVHLMLHTYRSAELLAEADRSRALASPPGLRGRMGWALVEIGLRLAQGRPVPAARAA
ncbi:hypothetical protein [Streptomyces nitrosporeus]|uniref:Uncharacterized protein n=1 Tax=Streptomyces nitrosporeus TaxID=28894 RepID=A0A5J6FCJ5_9ACTN|nr:hypothetical protein [Streptomyces nitrosporeus]QEU74249.1 hypothetical protein CP967_21645 [Streptomyces nitrosporeus]GGY96947.1 hypothetical protein GCM10010327_29530 [Streptomyces nitrosporeus]